MVVMGVYEMYKELDDFEVEQGGRVSGLSNSEIERLLERRGKGIKVKW